MFPAIDYVILDYHKSTEKSLIKLVFLVDYIFGLKIILEYLFQSFWGNFLIFEDRLHQGKYLFGPLRDGQELIFKACFDFLVLGEIKAAIPVFVFRVFLDIRDQGFLLLFMSVNFLQTFLYDRYVFLYFALISQFLLTKILLTFLDHF